MLKRFITYLNAKWEACLQLIISYISYIISYIIYGIVFYNILSNALEKAISSYCVVIYG